MLLWFLASCAVGFEGRNWHRLSSVLGRWSPGGILHQGRVAAICAMNLAGNTCNDDDDDDDDVLDYYYSHHYSDDDDDDAHSTKRTRRRTFSHLHQGHWWRKRR